VIREVDELTPCELLAGTWFKRDDLFRPYVDVPISGGKVRQAIRLLAPRAQQIAASGGRVYTATGVHSPQGLIIARVCAEYGLSCRLFIGATRAAHAWRAHRMLRTATHVGAVLDDSCGVAYETALAHTIDQYRARAPGFVVRFGINLDDDRAAIVDSTARQAQNVPDCVRTIVVPVGAGITAAGILLGVREHCPNVERVVLVQIAGMDRRKLISSIAPGEWYDWRTVTRWPYSRQLRARVDGVTLDPIYEAKAWRWCVDEQLTGRDVLFWLVGDSTAVR
jgi:1-aminocyclopropane-1-carboxylate deaminase/D-cysteine desulfhydrase-like pyridoxal-dependent ACC family enzyme